MITGSNLVGTSNKWGYGGMVDASDLKSGDSNIVRVQVPLSPPLTISRDVAQLGSALDLGSRGHRFESCHPDHLAG